jgi:hypothetical protein
MLTTVTPFLSETCLPESSLELHCDFPSYCNNSKNNNNDDNNNNYIVMSQRRVTSLKTLRIYLPWDTAETSVRNSQNLRAAIKIIPPPKETTRQLETSQSPPCSTNSNAENKKMHAA